MVTVSELSRKAMTPEKRVNAKKDIFAFYIGRPLSYVLTIPFLQFNVKPNTVSFLSILPSIMGFLILSFWGNEEGRWIGWLCFFLWNLLDGVDGNIARYTGQTSKLGGLWDATSGYFANVLLFCSMGMLAFHDTNSIVACACGYLAANMAIFPKLVMHKRMSLYGEASSEFNSKKDYNLLKVIALNVTSTSGFLQVIMLIAILNFHADFFCYTYFIINFVIMVYSCSKLLK